MRISVGLFLALFLILPACEEPIDIVPDAGNPQIVVDANFSSDDFFKVFLSEERPLQRDTTTYVSDAKVRILINEREVGSMSLVPADGTYPNRPFYQSTFKPRLGSTYTLEVEADGFPKIRAASMAPDPVPIINAQLDSVISSRPSQDRRETLYNFYGSITIKDPLAVQNYYHFAETILPIDWFTIIEGDTILIQDQEYFLAPVFLTDTQDPSFFELAQENGFLIDDTDFDGQEKVIPFRAAIAFDANFRLVNSLNVLFRSVSADYYKFHSTYTRQILAQESPFSEPVIVFNNVENGLGNFSGYSTYIDSVVLRR